MSLLKRANGSARKLATNRRNALKSPGPRLREGKRRARLNVWKHARHVRTSAEDVLKRLLRRRAQGGEDQKKRVSNFDERSRYVIENKRSGKRTKPNEADFSRWENRRL